ncbi:MAG: TRAP transporter small permease [Gemmobacter sp.]
MALAIAMLGVMLAAVSWQVVARYAMAMPPIWTEAIARYAMVWAGMLGAACAYRAGADPVLFPAALVRRGWTGKTLALVRAGGVMLLVGPVLWYALFDGRGEITRGFLARSAGRKADMLDLSMIWFTAAVPVGFMLIALHTLAMTAAILAADTLRTKADTA